MYNTEEMSLDDVRRRALSAYYTSGGDQIPSTVATLGLRGKRYVVLRRAGRVLACYRVRNDGKLKRLIRIPTGI